MPDYPFSNRIERFRLRCERREQRCLMAQTNTRNASLTTRPGSDGFKVVHHKIISIDGERPDLIVDLSRAILFKCLDQVHAAILTKIKAQTFRPIFDGMSD